MEDALYCLICHKLNSLCFTDIGRQVGEKIQRHFKGTIDPALQSVKILHQGRISMHGRAWVMMECKSLQMNTSASCFSIS